MKEKLYSYKHFIYRQVVSSKQPVINTELGKRKKEKKSIPEQTEGEIKKNDTKINKAKNGKTSEENQWNQSQVSGKINITDEPCKEDQEKKRQRQRLTTKVRRVEPSLTTGMERAVREVETKMKGQISRHPKATRLSQEETEF